VLEVKYQASFVKLLTLSSGCIAVAPLLAQLLIVAKSDIVSCFLYTCASVAITVQLFVAAVVLLGTTGEVPNVLVQLIV
jgi:hypothetical protein